MKYFYFPFGFDLFNPLRVTAKVQISFGILRCKSVHFLAGLLNCPKRMCSGWAMIAAPHC